MRNIFRDLLIVSFLLISICSVSKADEKTTDQVKADASDYNTTAYNEEIYDPFEPINRVVFKFNNVADRLVLEPAAKGFRKLPSPVQTGIGNFLSNLKLPIVIINQFLQGQFGNAASSTGRLIVNTTIGIGGLIDVADRVGLEEKEEDFGQTLATWGFGSGPYIVLPIFGPSNLRDTAGIIVSAGTDPTNIYLANQNEEWLIPVRTSVHAVERRSKIIEEVNTLRTHSVDYYASVRSSYSQNRDAAIKNRDDTQLTPLPVISVEFE